MQYTVFEQLKEHLLQPKVNSAVVVKGQAEIPSPILLSAFQAFLVGAISKTVATILTYPAIRYVILRISPPLASLLSAGRWKQFMWVKWQISQSSRS